MIERLVMQKISKQYPGCLANDKVNLTINENEIHALLGENGAGKSTLVKIIYGVTRADSGEMFWQGEKQDKLTPAKARELGIGMVFQHFSLFEGLTVLENIALGINVEQADKSLTDRIVTVSETYGLPLDPRREVYTLSVGERQRIEIVRALLQTPKLLIMDEPTSVLTPQEVDILFETLRQLSAEGVSILYISHKLDEIKALCDTASIMRGGKMVGSCNPKKESTNSMAEMMLGEHLKTLKRKAKVARGTLRLSVNNVAKTSTHMFGTDLDNINLKLYGNEILGIAGIAGNGQSELMEILNGEVLCDDNNAIEIDGVPIGQATVLKRRELGIAVVPEERLGHGAVPAMDLCENTFLSAAVPMNLTKNGFLQSDVIEQLSEKIVADFKVKTPSVNHTAASLSGGNLQKFIFGREMLQAPQVMIVLQPTWGVDAGSAQFLRQSLLDLAASGAAVLVISQDLDELFAISDKISVLSAGKLSKPMPAAALTLEKIGLLMGGVTEQLAPAEKTK